MSRVNVDDAFDAITTLIKKSAESTDSLDAQKFSGAACNIASALVSLSEVDVTLMASQYAT